MLGVRSAKLRRNKRKMSYLVQPNSTSCAPTALFNALRFQGLRQDFPQHFRKLCKLMKWEPGVGCYVPYIAEAHRKYGLTKFRKFSELGGNEWLQKGNGLIVHVLKQDKAKCQDEIGHPMFIGGIQVEGEIVRYLFTNFSRTPPHHRWLTLPEVAELYKHDEAPGQVMLLNAWRVPRK